MSATAGNIRDVFRQAYATGLTPTLLMVSILAAVGCFSLRIAAVAGSQVELTALLGTVTIVASSDAASALSHWQFLLAGIVADTVGVLLTLIWTASFLPTFLDRQSVGVVLVKPPSRSLLLLSRYVGVVLYVATLAAVFVGLTWAAMGIAIGDWNSKYWITVPFLVGHFAAFFAFSALLAVMTRNTTVCIVGTLLFWALCWAMNYGRHLLIVVQFQEASAGLSRLSEFGYWLLPKPLDFSLILANAFGVDQPVAQFLNVKTLHDAHGIQPIASVVSSLIAGAALLGLAIYEFRHDEY